MRILGLDLGEKRIGLAISDEGRSIASRLGVIERKGNAKDLKRLKEIIDLHGVEEIVIGLPKRLDGTLGPAAEKASRFADTLTSFLKTTIRLWDERFTTAISEQTLIEGNLSRKKRKGYIDRLSATLILQNYLDHLRQKAGNW